ncbi:glycoside hydrolase family 13 protein [Granulicatella seriolae]|uniref:Alpha-glucosidase n=1 Tax=Granulicatella seriolae TaxID=2967226 RepID=A0ABT1WQC3_9LACT|nr:alpha-glucosidase [Granulicatella seriolae]
MTNQVEPWWHGIVLYQVYPKSFQDSNNDGIGDIKGITSRLDYLKDLGVNMLWLNPVFASPQVDNGYDVSDYHSIDPEFGTMEDVEELIEEAHKRDIKIIFDFVANHTSDQHPWFLEALKGKDNPYRDYYLWADGKEGGQLAPNNWQSFFGGSVWEYDANSNQYYFHLFAKEMPDLNWRNPQVRQALKDIGLFWLGKGIDGFRVDAFIHIDKEDGYPDVFGLPEGEIGLAEHFYAHQPSVNGYMKDWADALRQEYPDIFIVGEASSSSPELGLWYTDPYQGGCNSVITFRYFTDDESLKDHRLPSNLQESKLEINSFKQIISAWQYTMMHRGGPTLYWNNHDLARAVSRFGNENPEFRQQSAKMLAILMYLQKGIPIIMNGEEIGMRNLQFHSLTELEAPETNAFIEKARRLGYSDEGILKNLQATIKDSSRGVMQWDDSEYAGFSEHEPWSGVNVEGIYNVRDQVGDPSSIYHFYKQVIDLKKTNFFIEAYWRLIDTNNEFYAYERQINGRVVLVICNLTDKEREFDSLHQWYGQGHTVLLENDGVRHEGTKVILPPYGASVIERI